MRIINYILFLATNIFNCYAFAQSDSTVQTKNALGIQQPLATVKFNWRDILRLNTSAMRN